MASDLTRSAVLALLGAQGPLSRAEIAKRTSVTQAAITQVTKDLLSSGLIRELDTTPSSGGRPARLLGLVHAAGRAVGVKVSSDHVTLADVGLDGSVRRSWSHPLDAAATSAPEALATAIATVVHELDGQEEPLLGVGVGVPGAVGDMATGVVDTPALGWTSFALGRHLQESLAVPVLIENDVNALAVAERLYGRGRDVDDFVVVTIGSGVGAALTMDGGVYRGSRGGAGEFGHTPVVADGPECRCGARGCLEAFIGQAGLLAAARAKGMRGLRSFDDLDAAIERRNPRALEVLAEAGALLGRATAGLVNLVDPSTVIVLGEGTRHWDDWRPTFEPALRRHLMANRRAVTVVRGEWQDTTWAQGAAALVLSAPFDATGASGRQGALVRERLTAEGRGRGRAKVRA